MDQQHIPVIRSDCLINVITNQRFKIGPAHIHPHEMIRIRDLADIPEQLVGPVRQDKSRIQQHHSPDFFRMGRRLCRFFSGVPIPGIRSGRLLLRHTAGTLPAGRRIDQMKSAVLQPFHVFQLKLRKGI